MHSQYRNFFDSQDRDTSSTASAIPIFQKYLQIKTVQPDPAYEESTSFLESYLTWAGFDETQVIHVTKGYPVVIGWIYSTRPEKPKDAICFYSHVDVVPVEEDMWSHPPFGGEIHHGNIYARGTQDMKCVGIQHVESCRWFKATQDTNKMNYNICVMFGPDEEVGGYRGMRAFVETEEFQALNIIYFFDEGKTSDTNVCPVHSKEKNVIWVTIHANGKAGHGSHLRKEPSAIMKITDIMTSIKAAHEESVHRWDKEGLEQGDVTSYQMTIIHGGSQCNVVPGSVALSIDIRVSPRDDIKEVKRKMEEMTLLHTGVTLEYLQDDSYLWDGENCIIETNIEENKETNPIWTSFLQALRETKCQYHVCCAPHATDSRFLRYKGINAVEFSYIPNTPVLLHDHDEHISVDVFEQGIVVFRAIVEKVVTS